MRNENNPKVWFTVIRFLYQWNENIYFDKGTSGFIPYWLCPFFAKGVCMRLFIVTLFLSSPWLWGAEKVQIDFKDDEVLYGKSFKSCNPLASGAKQKLANRFLKNQEIIKKKMSKVYIVNAKINESLKKDIALRDKKYTQFKSGCLTGKAYQDHLARHKKDGRIVRSINSVNNFYSKLKLESHNALTMLVKSCANKVGLSLYGLQTLVAKQERAIKKRYFDKLLLYANKRLNNLSKDFSAIKTCWASYVPNTNTMTNTNTNTMTKALDSFNKMNRIIKEYTDSVNKDRQKREKEWNRLNNRINYLDFY